jgi:hypothetical protein
MEQIYFSESNNGSVSQDISHLLHKSRIFIAFSQGSDIKPYPEPDEFSPHPNNPLFTIHFNISYQSTPTLPH